VALRGIERRQQARARPLSQLKVVGQAVVVVVPLAEVAETVAVRVAAVERADAEALDVVVLLGAVGKFRAIVRSVEVAIAVGIAGAVDIFVMVEIDRAAGALFQEPTWIQYVSPGSREEGDARLLS
jgi:hypothetical protein